MSNYISQFICGVGDGFPVPREAKRFPYKRDIQEKALSHSF